MIFTASSPEIYGSIFWILVFKENESKNFQKSVLAFIEIMSVISKTNDFGAVEIYDCPKLKMTKASVNAKCICCFVRINKNTLTTSMYQTDNNHWF
jgi:hypothetical protein